jgi:ferredoxin-NADP reductase
MEQVVPILSIRDITHNVRSYRVQKPDNYEFVPGQATEVAINKEGWKEEKRPFTFTSLGSEPYLEFTIKSYTDHSGVTNLLYHLKEGDELVIHDVWGAISYKGEGYFIAGGAGITPFIAILRMLYKQNKIGNNQLFFSNRTAKDIILKDEFVRMLGDKACFTLTEDPASPYDHSHIDEAYLKKHIRDFSKPFYVCGPDKMISDINSILIKLGANPERVVFEK